MVSEAFSVAFGVTTGIIMGLVFAGIFITVAEAVTSYTIKLFRKKDEQ